MEDLARALQLRQTRLQVPARPRTEPRSKRSARRHDHQRIQQAGTPARHPHQRLETSRTRQTIARASRPNRHASHTVPRNRRQDRQAIPSRCPQSQRGIESTLWLTHIMRAERASHNSAPATSHIQGRGRGNSSQSGSRSAPLRLDDGRDLRHNNEGRYTPSPFK